MTTESQIHQHPLSRPILWRSRITYTSAQKESIMQNKPNFPRFCAKNGYLEEKQTQNKANRIQFQTTRTKNKPKQTQFFTSFFLPILPIHPNQTQSVVSLSNLFKTTQACPERSTAKSKGLSRPSLWRRRTQQPRNFYFCNLAHKFVRSLLVTRITIEKENGAGGIRTPGTFRYNGFQDRRLKPLGHCSQVPATDNPCYSRQRLFQAHSAGSMSSARLPLLYKRRGRPARRSKNAIARLAGGAQDTRR